MLKILIEKDEKINFVIVSSGLGCEVLKLARPRDSFEIPYLLYLASANYIKTIYSRN